MTKQRRFRRTSRYIHIRWPIYVTVYGALIASLLLIGLSLALGWYSFVPFSLVITLIALYLLVALGYVAYQINDAPGKTSDETLFSMAQTQPNDRVVCIDLGLRETAVTIAQRLTTGEVTVIDIYNPQSNTNSALRRAREAARKPPADPRLNWIDSSIDLLPLPDRSVSSVYMNQILSEFWLLDEQKQLLEEVFRILTPEGRLVVAESVRSESDLLLTGLVTYTLPTADHWRKLLQGMGFIVQREDTLRGLVYCVRVDKPSPSAGKQLQLQLEFN